MGQRDCRHYVKVSRRNFLRRIVEGVAMGTGMVLLPPLFTLQIGDTYSNAGVVEWRNRSASMGYRRLGKTNIMVSEISFGCALNYGCNPVGYKLHRKLRGLFDKALEVGINLFDTTTNHKNGYTPEECFQHFRPVRDNVFLATKVDNFAPAATRASIEKSLRRIKTDYIDIVFLHNMRGRGGWVRGVPALEEIRKMIGEGKVRFAGVADHSYSNLLQVSNYKNLVDVILLRYSVKRIFEAEAVLSAANSFNIGTLGMKVFEGAYECWPNKAVSWADDTHLQPFISKGATVAQAAVRFVLNNPNLSSALIGMRTETEIIDNAAASSKSSRSISGYSWSILKHLFRRI